MKEAEIELEADVEVPNGAVTMDRSGTYTLGLTTRAYRPDEGIVLSLDGGVTVEGELDADRARWLAIELQHMADEIEEER